MASARVADVISRCCFSLNCCLLLQIAANQLTSTSQFSLPKEELKCLEIQGLMEEKQTKVTEDEILFSLNKGKESSPREKE